ncbi:MAG: hypothetical protein NTU53_25760 [Planctomycetota bacterium]|nr:hypothetical protein [Planctomycetota bacterium]
MIRLVFALFPLLVLASVAAAVPVYPDKPNALTFTPTDARFIRLVIYASNANQPCIDELEVYAADGNANLALASSGARAAASSCLPGYAIHQISHLNDGLYGNSHSWIAGGAAEEWAQIELPRPASVAKVVFSRDRQGRFKDRLPISLEVQLSVDGRSWQTVAEIEPRPVTAVVNRLPPTGPVSDDQLLRYAFTCEERSFAKLQAIDSTDRVLTLMQGVVDRLAGKGLDVSTERNELAHIRQAHEAVRQSGRGDRNLEWDTFWKARLAKRRLLLRDPDLAAIQKLLFVKRHPFVPSHNYSDLLDAQGPPGGGVFVLEFARPNGRLDARAPKLVQLFDSRNGVARDVTVDFDLSRICFAYQTSKSDYYHLMTMAADGSALRQITDGPFHDFYPCPLPDGGLAFMSTRCKVRFLCWRPQAFTLFRREAHGGNIRALSYANLSEWAPSVMNDGRILWTRSEYLDKGADFGHTLWAIRPDGTAPELIFGNNTRFCYVNGREIPGSNELCATLISHGGDLNGPIAIINAAKGRFDAALVTNITPDSPPQFHMVWATRECFRDPIPISRDYMVASHAPDDRFGLYIIDRFGNRELLYLDPAIGSMCPTPFRAVPRPPVIGTTDRIADIADATGLFYVADVYRGLEPAVQRGSVKHIRVCQEVQSELKRLANGEYQKDHEPFMDFYATPTHVVAGPHGWPTYVAKSDLGTAPVESDGSASFHAPAGKVLYFQVLDKDYNELQRMRSVVQLQPGERRGCIGCHEDRASAAPIGDRPKALQREPSRLEPPPWGAGPFAYEKVVQPVWDAKCIRCHDASDKRKINLTATPDAEKVAASYRTLIEQGLVHYFDCQWGQEHQRANPATFGTLKSRLWPLLDAGHYDVKLTVEEKRRIKCWIDLNCPLWPDYVLRSTRGVAGASAGDRQ